MFDVYGFRKEFPLLTNKGSSLVYVDNASTTHKPSRVIEKISDFYKNHYANVDYSMYDLSEYVSSAYNDVRRLVASFCNVDEKEIIFTSGATEGMNLLASSYSQAFLSKNDEIIIGSAEHHSSCLPWMRIAKLIGAKIKWIPLTGKYFEVDIDKYKTLFNKSTKLVVIQHSSNVLGNINDIKLLSNIAHNNGANIVVDGAASLLHGNLNLKEIDCDFFVTSGHKCFGPSGSGFVFGKYDLLKEMPPYRVGGRMVERVNFDDISYKLPPERFEAGSANIASIIGFGETIKFIQSVDCSATKNYFRKLIEYTRNELQLVPNIIPFGSGKNGVFSFNIKNVHAHDIATILATKGIAIRAGNHCAQPLMRILKTGGTARISLAPYNTKEEIDFIVKSLQYCCKYFFKPLS